MDQKAVLSHTKYFIVSFDLAYSCISRSCVPLWWVVFRCSYADSASSLSVESAHPTSANHMMRAGTGSAVPPSAILL
jgi:hypothetical protein